MAETHSDGNGSGENPLFHGGLPPLYTRPVAIDASKHARLGLKEFGPEISRNLNAIPINLVEFSRVCHHIPIAFTPDGNATPVAIVGLRKNENLLIDETGDWIDGSYMPAYVRRYPFIFAEQEGSDQLTLCVDMNGDIVGEDGAHRIFGEDGQPTEIVKHALEFCKSYHSGAVATKEFSKALAQSGLLENRELVLRAGNRKIAFSGFQIIPDERKIDAMPDEMFLDWRRRGWLPFLYAHLFSGTQWEKLGQLLERRLAAEQA